MWLLILRLDLGADFGLCDDGATQLLDAGPVFVVHLEHGREHPDPRGFFTRGVRSDGGDGDLHSDR